MEGSALESVKNGRILVQHNRSGRVKEGQFPKNKFTLFQIEADLLSFTSKATGCQILENHHLMWNVS
jgi:hypothetical protein